MTTEDKVKQIIADLLMVDLEAVTPGANLRDDLGVDSLDMVELTMLVEEEFDLELTMLVEEEFDLEIPDEDVRNIKTVKDFVKYVKSKVKNS